MCSSDLGLLVPLDDPEGFRAAIKELLSSEQHRKEMGTAARQAMQTHFSIDRMVAEYETLLQDAAHATGRGMARTSRPEEKHGGPSPHCR